MQFGCTYVRSTNKHRWLNESTCNTCCHAGSIICKVLHHSDDTLCLEGFADKLMQWRSVLITQPFSCNYWDMHLSSSCLCSHSETAFAGWAVCTYCNLRWERCQQFWHRFDPTSKSWSVCQCQKLACADHRTLVSNNICSYVTHTSIACNAIAQRCTEKVFVALIAQSMQSVTCSLD